MITSVHGSPAFNENVPAKQFWQSVELTDPANEVVPLKLL